MCFFVPAFRPTSSDAAWPVSGSSSGLEPSSSLELQIGSEVCRTRRRQGCLVRIASDLLQLIRLRRGQRQRLCPSWVARTSTARGGAGTPALRATRLRLRWRSSCCVVFVISTAAGLFLAAAGLVGFLGCRRCRGILAVAGCVVLGNRTGRDWRPLAAGSPSEGGWAAEPPGAIPESPPGSSPPPCPPGFPGAANRATHGRFRPHRNRAYARAGRKGPSVLVVCSLHDSEQTPPDMHCHNLLPQHIQTARYGVVG